MTKDFWIKTSHLMPASGRVVLAYYKNAHGKDRIIRACWIAANTEECNPDDDIDDVGAYNKENETYYWHEGWYEQIDNWDAYSAVMVHHEITHWTPLPFPPER